jgi:hypothetical protein
MKTPTPHHNRQHKDKQFEGQMKRVFAAFYSQPKTMLMVERETGIMRPNICRYVSRWKKLGSIKIVSLCICPISKRGGVQRLTTNPELFPTSNQIKLF